MASLWENLVHLDPSVSCDHCGRSETELGQRLVPCSGCGKVYYCDWGCELAGLESHRMICSWDRYDEPLRLFDRAGGPAEYVHSEPEPESHSLQQPFDQFETPPEHVLTGPNPGVDPPVSLVLLSPLILAQSILAHDAGSVLLRRWRLSKNTLPSSTTFGPLG